MKEKFPEFYVNFDELWKDAVFVFDTNVLLDILRMPKSERDSFIKILTELKKTNTVWLPFHHLKPICVNSVIKKLDYLHLRFLPSILLIYNLQLLLAVA